MSDDSAVIDQERVFGLFKHATVIPIPKKDNPKLPNDFRLIAFTSLVMQTLEKNH